MSFNMKVSHIAALFFTAFVTYVNGQGDAIDIEGIKCLCKLQIIANAQGEAEASASDTADCGLGDPAPKLAIDCNAVWNDNVDGAFFYILEAKRTSLRGSGPMVTFDKDSNDEVTAVNFPQGLSEDNDLTIVAGRLVINNYYKDTIWKLKDQDIYRLSLCKNDQTPGSFQYTLVEMSNQLILDGRGCPLEEGEKTSIMEDPSQRFPPTIYQFPEMLPCKPLSWSVTMNDRNDQYVLKIWIDFEPKGSCQRQTRA